MSSHSSLMYDTVIDLVMLSKASVFVLIIWYEFTEDQIGINMKIEDYNAKTM